MKHPVKYLLTLFTSICLLSCIPQRYLDIQVLKPAQVSWSQKIDTLFLLEALKIKTNGKNTNDKSLYIKFLQSFNKSFSEKLKKSPLFVNTNIKIISFDYLYDNYLNSELEERKHIFACAVQSLGITDTTYVTEDEFYNHVTCQAIYRATLKFYNFTHQNMEFTIEDTVYWDSKPVYYIYDIDTIVTDKSEAYTELGEFAAEKLARNIAPYWITEERVIYYNSNYIMRKGYKQFVENDAAGAINFWENIYKSGTKKLAHNAAFNIALSYETMDSLNLSNEWLDKALKIKKDSVTIKYKRLIESRITEKLKLDEQFKLKSKQIK